tara:strand:+ start:173 stop:1780 length:1608 start_codon:yes stop_codon:yes gene_type:complete
MAISITYGSYNFPDPIPLVAEEDRAISIAGNYDHSEITVNLVGYFTGSDLSELDLQKMQMVSGFLDEYQDLTITVNNEEKVCPKASVKSISFKESDLTTFLPYSLSVTYYSGETFSNYFKITDPKNNWDYKEQENNTVLATHAVSARGLKVDGGDELDNARFFVTGELEGGFSDIAIFNSPNGSAYLQSRVENIDKKNNVYGVTESYLYSTSQDTIFEDISGIVGVNTSISYDYAGGLSVSLQGSVKGNIDANTGVQEGLLSTGDFTLEHATEVALNAIVSSYSDYESGVYSFVSDGPTSFQYDLDTGANTLGFAFQFSDPENLDIINGNVVHTYATSISISKDAPVASIGVQGQLRYRGAEFISNTGEFESNSRFQAIESAFLEVNPEFIAYETMNDFTGVATGYEFKSSYIDTGEINFSINKDPVENILNYSYNYNNEVDLSNGDLKDFSINIVDKKPIQLSQVQETLNGFAAQTIASRTLGQYSISSSSNDASNKLNDLKTLSQDYCSGQYKISESYQTGENKISYSLSKYY